MNNLSFPIGPYEPAPFSEAQRKKWLADLRYLPLELEQSVLNLDEAQLHTPYRPGGWTAHQVVHHVVDSHMNAILRCKLALSEDWPVIKPYDQDAFIQQADVLKTPVNTSLTLLHALHERWVYLMEAVGPEQWEERGVVHPEYGRRMSLWYLLGNYAWHGRHHTAHIKALRERMGW